MGKKSKHKQQRRANKSTNQSQPISQNTATTAGLTMTIGMPSNSQPSTGSPVTSQPKPSGQISPLVSEEYIRQDIFRIILTLSVIVAILIAAVIVNDRSTILQSAGKHLASFLKLQ